MLEWWVHATVWGGFVVLLATIWFGGAHFRVREERARLAEKRAKDAAHQFQWERIRPTGTLMGVLWKFEAKHFRVAEGLNTEALRRKMRWPNTTTLEGGPWLLEKANSRGDDIVLYFQTAREGHRICIHGSAAELRGMCLEILAKLIEEG